VLLQSTAWCISHLGVSCVNHNSSRIGPIAHNSNRGNSSSNSRGSNINSSSTMPLLHRRSRLPSGDHNSFSPATSQASTAGRWATLLENAVCPSKATRRELLHLWSISRGAIRKVLHHGWLMTTTPPWRRFPREKKCYQVRSSSTSIPLLFYLILEHHITLRAPPVLRKQSCHLWPRECHM
jgi:hypothetical protein